MTVHLTDDELVAVCGLLEVAWPYPLPTVDSGNEELEAASVRGIRSLTVRGLLGFEDNEQVPGIDLEVAETVKAVASGVPAFVSGLLDAEGALQASGSAAYIVHGNADSAILATTTATGIHALAICTHEDALDAFLAIVDNALIAGIAAIESARLLVLKAGDGGRALAVARGLVTVGAVDSRGLFVPSSVPAGGWDRDALETHLAA